MIHGPFMALTLKNSIRINGGIGISTTMYFSAGGIGVFRLANKYVFILPGWGVFPNRIAYEIHW